VYSEDTPAFPFQAPCWIPREAIPSGLYGLAVVFGWGRDGGMRLFSTFLKAFNNAAAQR
jgi:hypothetical protein